MDDPICTQGGNRLSSSSDQGLELSLEVQFPDPLTVRPSAFDEVHAEDEFQSEA